MLAALALLPLAGKTLHLAASCRQELAEPAHHNCSDCPVCLFTLSPFTEAEAPDADRAICCADFRIFTYNRKALSRAISYFNLRAPPLSGRARLASIS